MSKHAVINNVITELKKIGITAKTFNGRTVVSDTKDKADYHGGEFGAPFIAPELERIAAAANMYWEWLNPQELHLCSL